MPHHAFMSPGWWGAPTATHSSPSQPPQSSMLPPMLLPGGVMPAYAPLMAPGGFKEVPPGPSRGSHGSPAQLPGARGNPPHAVGPSDDAYNCEVNSTTAVTEHECFSGSVWPLICTGEVYFVQGGMQQSCSQIWISCGHSDIAAADWAAVLIHMHAKCALRMLQFPQPSMQLHCVRVPAAATR